MNGSWTKWKISPSPSEKNLPLTVCKPAHSELISTNCGLQTPLWSGVSNEGVLLLPFIVALAIAISFKACGISRLGANKQLEVKLSQLPLPQGISINEVQSRGMFACFIWGLNASKEHQEKRWEDHCLYVTAPTCLPQLLFFDHFWLFVLWTVYYKMRFRLPFWGAKYV